MNDIAQLELQTLDSSISLPKEPVIGNEYKTDLLGVPLGPNIYSPDSPTLAMIVRLMAGNGMYSFYLLHQIRPPWDQTINLCGTVIQ